MKDLHLGIVETQFAELIWSHEPIQSGELVKLAEEKLKWKKSTTYTVLKKLCERGIFENRDSTVLSIIPKEEFYSIQTEAFVKTTFDGSLPAFIAAFTSRKKLTQKEIDEIKTMIDTYTGE